MASTNFTMSNPFQNFWKRLVAKRGLISGIIIVTALLAFESFNFMSTFYALDDLLGKLSFAGISWALILAVAFCGIDFAGIARLFSPRGTSSKQQEVWYLFAAWLLAATMNAMLTWWGVSLAILTAQSAGSAVIARQTLVKIVPIFVAVLVWLIRVLIIGSFSIAGEELFAHEGRTATSNSKFEPSFTGSTANTNSRQVNSGNGRMPLPKPNPAMANSYKPAPKTGYKENPVDPARPEPTYHSVNGGNPTQPVSAAANRDAAKTNSVSAASPPTGPFSRHS
jgi:hypothetical protein